MREPMLIIHLISVATFVGAALSSFILNKVANKQESSTKLSIKSALLSLNYLGKTGLTLLIITGGYLMTPYWPALGQMPLLIAKLSVVVILLVVLVMLSIKAKKAKKEKTESAFIPLDKLNALNLFLGIAVIALAVLVFS